MNYMIRETERNKFISGSAIPIHTVLFFYSFLVPLFKICTVVVKMYVQFKTIDIFVFIFKYIIEAVLETWGLYGSLLLRGIRRCLAKNHKDTLYITKQILIQITFSVSVCFCRQNIFFYFVPYTWWLNLTWRSIKSKYCTTPHHTASTSLWDTIGF